MLKFEKGGDKGRNGHLKFTCILFNVRGGRGEECGSVGGVLVSFRE